MRKNNKNENCAHMVEGGGRELSSIEVTDYIILEGFAAGWVMASSSSGSFIFAWLMRSLLNIYHSDTKPKRGP